MSSTVHCGQKELIIYSSTDSLWPQCGTVIQLKTIHCLLVLRPMHWKFWIFLKVELWYLAKVFLPLSILEMFWFCYALVGHFASHPSKSTLKPENYYLYHPKFIRISDIYKLFVMSNKGIYLHTYTNKM